jgi:hypothetical protein
MKRISSIAALILLISASAWAQATAQLNGTVKDESGAVLPGVTVTATQTDTGFTRSVVTDDSGTYVLTNLPTGPYKLEVSLQGFSTYAQTGIVLQVGGTPTINAVLAVGSLEETVAVEAAAPLVDVRSAGISTVVEQERILELPLQGRNVTDLIALAGSAVQTSVGTKSQTGSALTAVAGGLPFGVTYLLDGAAHNNPFDNLNMPLPFPDALQEFRVATSGLSADNGVHSGGSVNAVTKSGTNVFHGAGFEFFRGHQFNAIPRFSPIGRDGTPLDDGLRRNQFGGTLGGPIARDRLFFFGGYQGTKQFVQLPDTVTTIPTAAMLKGDFTDVASPACNGGRQLTLRAPFVNNRVDPSLLSPAALKLSARLPTTTDPCGVYRYSTPQDYRQGQSIGRVDFQISRDQSLFGRYMYTQDHQPSVWPSSGNLLSINSSLDLSHWAHSLTVGHTQVFGSNTVNAVRVSWNRANTNYHLAPWFGAEDLGVKGFYNYQPGYMGATISGGFTLSSSQLYNGKTDGYQASDDLTLVRGNHQFGFGAHLSTNKFFTEDYNQPAGKFIFNNANTGLGLGDFLLGRLNQIQHGTVGYLRNSMPYVGAYAQDAWRMHPRLTLNMGVRWEPFFWQALKDAVIANYSLANFQKGIKTTQYVNAPPGFLYPGDPGYPAGSSGVKSHWFNMAPRVGLAWDVSGNGRTAIRSSYGLGYDFQTADWAFTSSTAAPYGRRWVINSPAGGFDDPYRGDPSGVAQPIPNPPPSTVTYYDHTILYAMDPDINSPRVQSWNALIERQLGTNWQASAGYLGNYMDRIWGLNNGNPGVFLGVGPCTLNGVSYPVCTTNANLDQRRKLSLIDPVGSRAIGAIGEYRSWGKEKYNALRLSVQRRATGGIRIDGNYTLSYCQGNAIQSGLSSGASEFRKSDDPEFDVGNCQWSQRHIGILTVGVRTPSFTNLALHAVASNWNVSGILRANSGTFLTVTTTQDVQATGAIAGNSSERVDQVLANPYGDRTLTNYLNRSAFAYPALGSYGTEKPFAVQGPAYWTIDLALVRSLLLGGNRSVELRLETFNLLNHFNWGNPVVNFDSAQFGQVQTQSGSSRILQFGIKYGF